MAESAGKKISVPVDVEAASNPITRPRLVTNQRLTMVADRTLATQPDPMPDTTPQDRINCHGAVIQRLAMAEALISASAAMTTLRMPKRCIAAAAKGPVRPNRKIPTAAAKEITLRDQ